MTEKPILFSSPMIRAILAGTKTQTRRIVKPQPNEGAFVACPHGTAERPRWGQSLNGYICGQDGIRELQGLVGRRKYWHAPYPVGTRLWVRETFAIEHQVDDNAPPFNDGRPVRIVKHPDGEWWEQPHYRATDPTPELAYDDTDGEPTVKWRPSIFMPRWASRISLEVTDVRVERLTDISEDDCKAEGIVAPPMEDEGAFCYEEAYADLWDSINGKKHPWESNVWVWAYTFRRVTP